MTKSETPCNTEGTSLALAASEGTSAPHTPEKPKENDVTHEHLVMVARAARKLADVAADAKSEAEDAWDDANALAEEAEMTAWLARPPETAADREHTSRELLLLTAAAADSRRC